MELHVKPGDKIRSDVEYLVDNEVVRIGIIDNIGLGFAPGRMVLYDNLCYLRLINREDKTFRKWRYSPRKYEVLEDKTIVLFDED